MNVTAIEWTDVTWNPASGCQKVSAGCKYCYAETLSEQKRGTRAFPNGFGLTIRPHKLDEPRRLRRPSMVFVNSMSDLFWEAIPADYRDRVVDVIEATPQHQYQVLTKRPHLMRDYSRRRRLPANLWAGTTVESQAVAGRADVLREVDASTRFLSIEPMLTRFDDPAALVWGIDWVIVGGESGLHLRDPQIRAARSLVERDERGRWVPRPERLDWVRDIRDACAASGAAFFLKQWGGPTPKSGGSDLDGRQWKEFPAV